MNPQTEERSASPELLEQVPEVEARVVEEMTTKVLGPVREITEGARGAIKKIIVESATLFIRARTMFAAQGRRAPVETQNKRRK